MGHYKSIETTIIFIIFKAQIQKTKIMAPGPITSWQIDGVERKQFQHSVSLTGAAWEPHHGSSLVSKSNLQEYLTKEARSSKDALTLR